MQRSIHVRSGFMIYFPKQEDAVDNTRFLIGELLYPGENRNLVAKRDAVGDLSFDTWVGKVTVSKIMMEGGYVVSFPMSTRSEGYEILPALAARVSAASGKFSASGLGGMIDRMGAEALALARQQQRQAAGLPVLGGGRHINHRPGHP